MDQIMETNPQAFEMYLFWLIIKHSWLPKTTNVEAIETFIYNQRKKYIGHVMSKEKYFWTIEGNRWVVRKTSSWLTDRKNLRQFTATDMFRDATLKLMVARWMLATAAGWEDKMEKNKMWNEKYNKRVQKAILEVDVIVSDRHIKTLWASSQQLAINPQQFYMRN